MKRNNSLQFEFYCTDPIIKLIRERWNFPVWSIPLIMILLDAGLYFGLGNYLGFLHSVTINGILVKGTLDAPKELIISFIFQPIIFAYFLWFPSRVKLVFIDLIKNDVIPKNVQSNKYTEFLKYFTRIYNHPLIVWLSVIFGLIIAIWMTTWSTGMKFEGFWVHYLVWPYLVFETSKVFFIGYAIGDLFCHLLITQFGISELFRRIEINVQPLHHDGAGGLASIGNLIGSYFYWLIPVSFFVITTGIVERFSRGNFPYYVILEFTILPIFTCIAFFWPSLSTHFAMQKSIEREVCKINHDYQLLLNSIKDSNSFPSKSELKALNKLINTSIRIREISPTWPFNSQAYTRFFASLGTSSIPLVSSLIEKYLTPYFPKGTP